MPSALPKNLVVKFDCENYSTEEVIVARDELPVKKKGLVFHRANLPKGTGFSTSIEYGRENIDSLSDNLPVDWSNPLEWAGEAYSKADKGILNSIPVVGGVLEQLAPDVRWHFDLWYDFGVDESGKLKYKLHFGPTSNVEVRQKLEGKKRLL